MEKSFFDTEFIEWAGGIELVSLGIVTETGRTFYAESMQFDERNADPWVKENVLKKLHYHPSGEKTILPVKPNSFLELLIGENSTPINMRVFGTISFIKDALINFYLNEPDPIFYAYFADYDWVLLCRIFGRMIDLPKKFPFWCIDLKQMMWERGLSKEWKQETVPDPEGEHDAGVDAIWNLSLYKEVIKHPVK